MVRAHPIKVSSFPTKNNIFLLISQQLILYISPKIFLLFLLIVSLLSSSLSLLVSFFHYRIPCYSSHSSYQSKIFYYPSMSSTALIDSCSTLQSFASMYSKTSLYAESCPSFFQVITFLSRADKFLYNPAR